MVRTPLTPEAHERGERLGRLTRQARGPRSTVEVAAAAGPSPETLRRTGTDRAPAPAFFTGAAPAPALALPPDGLVLLCAPVTAAA